MKKTEFEIGQDFYTDTGKWRCTDIGTRIITAIQLNQDNPTIYQEPPYSVPEHVFDEDDMEGCSFEASEPDNIEELLKNKKLDEIHCALMFVSSGGGYGESSAILDKKTWKIYLRSDLCDIEQEDQLSEYDYDKEIHIEIPHKNELGLGRNLVFEFVEQFIPEGEAKVDQIFRKKGAYTRYKDFLNSKGLLDKWYEFENKSELIALSLWCKENDIDLTG